MPMLTPRLWKGGTLVALWLGCGFGCGIDEPITRAGTASAAGGASALTGTASGGATGGVGGDGGMSSEAGAENATSSGAVGTTSAGGSAGGSSDGTVSTGGMVNTGGMVSTDTGSGGTGSEPPVVDVTLSFSGTRLAGSSGTVDFVFLPGAPDELFVLGHAGVLYHFRLEGDSVTLIEQASLPNTLQAKGCGALSLALDPEFEQNHFVYITRCVDLERSTLARYETDDFEALAATESEILSVSVPWDRDEWHRFGSMGFESDGATLWVLLGDMFFPEYAQDTTKKNGSLLRIVPNREPDGSGYTQASGNAFAAEESDPDVYAYGLRSPWRGSRDRFGRFWVGDVGDVTAEEVNLVSEAGQNFGWRDHEGPCVGECTNLRDPIFHYGRSMGRAIWVGASYESPSIDRYYGWFDDQVFFGDFYGGWVRALEVNEHGSLLANREVGQLSEVTQWRVGPDGYMYALILSGYLYRAVPEPVFAEVGD